MWRRTGSGFGDNMSHAPDAPKDTHILYCQAVRVRVQLLGKKTTGNAEGRVRGRFPSERGSPSAHAAPKRSKAQKLAPPVVTGTARPKSGKGKRPVARRKS